jgi:hypothetical protein
MVFVRTEAARSTTKTDNTTLEGIHSYRSTCVLSFRIKESNAQFPKNTTFTNTEDFEQHSQAKYISKNIKTKIIQNTGSSDAPLQQ